MHLSRAAALTAALAALVSCARPVAVLAVHAGAPAGIARPVAGAPASPHLAPAGTLEARAALTGIDAVAWSDDATALALLSGPEIEVLDVATMRERRRLRGHLGEVTTACFEPGGARLVSGGADGTVRVWSLDTGDALRTLGFAAAIDRVVCGKGLARVAAGREVCTWSLDDASALGQCTSFGRRSDDEPADGPPARTIHPIDLPQHETFFPSDDLTTASVGGDVVRTDTGEPVSPPPPDPTLRDRYCDARSKDLARATAWADGGVVLRDGRGHVVRKLTTYEDGCGGAAFAGGLLFVYGARSAGVDVFDATSGAKLRVLDGPGGQVTALEVLQGSVVMLVVEATRAEDWDGGAGLRVWDASSGAALLAVDRAASLSVSPGARALFWRRRNDGHVWDVASRQQRTLPLESAPLVRLAASEDGDTLAVLGADGVVHLLRSGTPPRAVATGREGSRGRGRSARALALSADGSTFAVAGAPDGAVYVGSVADGGELRRFGDATSKGGDAEDAWYYPPALGLTAHGERVAFYLHGRKSVEVDDVESGALVAKVDVPPAAADDAEPPRVWIAEDAGRAVVSSPASHALRVVDLSTGKDAAKVLPEERGSPVDVRDIVFFPGGGVGVVPQAMANASGASPFTFIAALTSMGTAHDETLAQDRYDRECFVERFRPEDGQFVRLYDGCRALAVSPDGAVFASVASDRQIDLWDARTGRARATLPATPAGMNALAFAGKTRLVAAGDDGWLRTWDVATSSPGEAYFFVDGGKATLERFPDGSVALFGDVAAARAALTCRRGSLPLPYEACAPRERAP